MTKVITALQIKEWMRRGEPVAKAQGEVAGLTFTLSKNGTAAWILRYRFGGRPREYTIGRFPEFSIASAKASAIEARARIQQGIDVAQDKQKNLTERKESQTFRALTDDYMTKVMVFPNMANSTIKQRTSHIKKHILPKLASLPAKEVTPLDIVRVIENVGKNSVSVAELTLTAISEIFKHGIRKHIVSTNPCAGLSIGAICGTQPVRERLMLTEREIRVLLTNADKLGRENALATKILLATCVRTGELAKALWEHVDVEGTAKWTHTNGDPIEAEGAKWLIPVENQKTGKKSQRGFVIPLTSETTQWFKELNTLACGSKFVLPARQLRRKETHGEEVPYEQRSLNAMYHKLCEKLGEQIRRFTPHDLRSTARSHLTALGVDVIVAERCLNHKVGGLIGIYDKFDYFKERRAALETWGAFISACETDTKWNIIPFKRA